MGVRWLTRNLAFACWNESEDDLEPLCRRGAVSSNGGTSDGHGAVSPEERSEISKAQARLANGADVARD